MEEIGFGNSKKDKGHDRAADAWMGVFYLFRWLEDEDASCVRLH